MSFFKKGAMLAAVAVASLTASQAFADTGWSVWQAPTESNSWTFGITLQNDEQFDGFTAVWSTFGSPFEDNNGNVNNVGDGNVAVDSFSDASWAQNTVSIAFGGGWTTVTADGDLVTDQDVDDNYVLDVLFHFVGELTNGTFVTVQMMNGTNNVGNAIIFGQQPTLPIPLPPAVWAGLATLGAMGAFLAQRRRSRQLLV